MITSLQRLPQVRLPHCTNMRFNQVDCYLVRLFMIFSHIDLLISSCCIKLSCCLSLLILMFLNRTVEQKIRNYSVSLHYYWDICCCYFTSSLSCSRSHNSIMSTNQCQVSIKGCSHISVCIYGSNQLIPTINGRIMTNVCIYLKTLTELLLLFVNFNDCSVTSSFLSDIITTAEAFYRSIHLIIGPLTLVSDTVTSVRIGREH